MELLLGTHVYGQSPLGSHWTLATDEVPWGKRWGHMAVSFDGKLWVMGGSVENDSLKNDVWCSANGVDWTQVSTSSPMWAPRFMGAALVYDNKMWIMGGYVQISTNSSSVRANDVWCSADGVHWTEATDSAQWSPRDRHVVTVFGDKMWVMGGLTDPAPGQTAPSSESNQIWSSTDGQTWVQSTPTGSIWAPRYGSSVAVFDGKMWVMGGMSNCAYLNDVWNTPDGDSWTQVTIGMPTWAPRYLHISVVAGEKMWLFGGKNSHGIDYCNDVWTTADGATWTEATPAAEWPVRHRLSAVVHDQRVWVMGGDSIDNFSVIHALSDVWYTPASVKNAADGQWAYYP